MKKVSKKSLNSSFWRWFYGNLTCFSHEHMQTFGYMWSMLPIIQELYETKDEQAEKLQTYYPFFNTEPQIGSIVVGITAGLEEARANGAEEIDDEMINGIRAGLMGPLAGIGDSLIVGTYIPVLLGIALGLAEGGSIIGPLFYIVVWNVTTTSVQLTTSIQNKTEMVIEGSKVIEKVTGTQEVPVLLQEKLDGAFPGVLTLLFVLGCWWLMAKKAISPIKIMLLMVVVAIVGVLVGFFDPGLSY